MTESAWTPERVSQMRNLIDRQISAREIGEIMGGFTPKQITSKAFRLGLKLGRSPGGGTVRTWTPAKIEQLRALVDERLIVQQIAARMGSTAKAVQTVMSRCGIKSKAPPNIPVFWTEERVAVLRQLAAKGLSGSQIAAQIGGGCSRSSVIIAARRKKIALMGHITRLNLPRVARTGSKLSELKLSELKPKIRPARPPAHPDEPKPLGEPMFLAGANECHWIDGDPMTVSWRMCCHPVHDRSKWCAHHWLRVYEPKGKA